MTQRYQWGVEITRQWLEDDGSPDGDPGVEVNRRSSEDDARAVLRDIRYRMKQPERQPRYTRILGAELVRRPVGDWEKVPDGDLG